MKFNDVIKLAVKCLVETLKGRGEKPRLKIAVIPSETKRFRNLTDEEIAAYMKDL